MYKLASKIPTLLTVAGLILVCIIIYHRSIGSAPMPQNPILVTTKTVESINLPFKLQDVGTVTPYETVAVNSRIDSQIVSVNFKDGDDVNKGDILYQLDDSEIKTQIEQAKATLEHDQATLVDLKIQYDRKIALLKSKFGTQSDVDDAKASYEAQLATVKSTQASIDNLVVQLGYTKVVAPINGRAGTINITEGTNVKANDTVVLVTVNQIKPIKIQTSLPQKYFTAVRSAMSAGTVNVKIKADKLKDEIDGALQYIDNAVNQMTSTFVVRAVTANDDEALWPGMFVSITLLLESAGNSIVIPEAAVQHGQNGDFVYVAQDGKSHIQNITIERFQDGLAIISTGLSAGQELITDGMVSLKEGVAIITQNNEPNKS
ncbi:MAG: efflux RND transporter periplasmic adaptor subunit [Rickettsiales bacterium]